MFTHAFRSDRTEVAVRSLKQHGKVSYSAIGNSVGEHRGRSAKALDNDGDCPEIIR